MGVGDKGLVRVKGVAWRVEGGGVRVSKGLGSGFRVSGVGVRSSGMGFRVSSLGRQNLLKNLVSPLRSEAARIQGFNLRTTTSQKCEALPGRARIQGS